MQPRLGMALRPVAGSSLVIRAGWGIYRNTAVYQSIALMLAQQPPLSKALSIESTPAASVDAGEWIQRAGEGVVEYVCRRSGFSRQLRAQLAGVGSARSAGVADGHRDVSGHEGQPSDAGVRAEHLSDRRRESVCVVSERLRVSHVERQLAEKRRAAAGAQAAAARIDGRRQLYVCQGDRQRRRIHDCRSERRRDCAELARPRRRTCAVSLRSASSADGAGRICRQRVSAELGVHEPAQRRQRFAGDAAVSHVACRHRSHRSAARELHRRAR